MAQSSGSNQEWKNHVQVAIIKYYPWINEIWKDDNGVVQCTGIYYDLMKLLSKVANFTYELYADADLGSGFRYPNGTWTGAGGMLQQKEVDLFFPWAEPRDEGILSSWPVFITDTKMLASLGFPEAASFINFLFTFDVEIWYILFSSIFVTILISAISDVFVKFKRVDRKLVMKEIDYYFWMFLSALFCEGSFKVPRSRRSQFLLALWLLGILTLMNAFSGQFKAQLMKQKEEDRIQTPGDLADRPHLIPIMSKETTIQFCFQRSPVEDYQRVWKIAQAYGDKSLVHMDYLKEIDTYQKAKDGTSVVIFEVTSLRSYFYKICRKLTGFRKMYFSDPNLDFLMLTFSTRTDLPKDFLHNFNLWIKRMTEAFIFEKTLKQAMWINDDCEDDPPEPSLKMKNLAPIFYLLFALDAIALTVLIIEVLLFKYKQNAKEKLEMEGLSY